MPKQVRYRRGTTAQHAPFVGAEGEVTFDTTKKVIVLHDGVTPGGKPVDGFLVLDPGSLLLSQVIKSCISVTGGDDDTTAFSVVNLASFNNVNINAQASVRRLQMHQEQIPYASNIVLNFASFGSKRITLTGNVTFSATGALFGSYLNLRILCDGTPRNLNWPGWKFVGAAAPASIAANKTALLHLWAFGLADTDVVAQYIVEP
jgi:hypothetical protein